MSARHPTTSTPQAALEQARDILEHASPTPSLRLLAEQGGLSPGWLQRRFRARFGVSPAEYVRAHRFDELKQALRDGAAVSDAVYAAGFGSGSRVYEHSDRLLGMPPSKYRAGSPGVAIRYTTIDCPLGRVLVAATTRGLCAVTLGDDDATLLVALQQEFPHANLSRVDTGRNQWLAATVNRIARQFNDGRDDDPAPLPPLDVTASAFQWRVWDALTRIPVGETRSYGEIAAAIGEPGAARAVGRACGSNQLALIVPCHRVIRADGSIGGWRWGVARKQVLLERERAVAAR